MSHSSDEGLNRPPSTATCDIASGPGGVTSKEKEGEAGGEPTAEASRRRTYEPPRLSRIVLAQSDTTTDPKYTTLGGHSSPNVSGATVFGW